MPFRATARRTKPSDTMLKRILVALDPDQDTETATRYGMELAKRHEALVSGLAVVDTLSIAREIGPGGAVGAMYYAEKLREQITTESRQAASRLIEAFEAELDEGGVRHAEQVREGVPARRIVEDTKYHDVLVVGRTAHFYYPDPEKETETLARIVKMSACPTLVVPDDHREVGTVLIAYDGSAAAARTFQEFARLRPFGQDVALELVHVRSKGSEAVRRESDLLLMLVEKYLSAHGFDRIATSNLEADEPGPAILDHARSIGADLIVAGAHAVSAIQRLAFGSTTDHFLRECDLPFFLYS